MSKFNKYARQIDEMAKTSFEEYLKTKEALAKATEKAREYPLRPGCTAEYNAKSARAQADLVEAQTAEKAARRALQNNSAKIKTLREELVKELNDTFVVDPAAVDNNALELLKSGMLKSNDYASLAKKAQADGNYTMIRMIAKYAGDAAKAEAAQHGETNNPVATELRRISYMGDVYNGNEHLQAFDSLAEVYSRTANNTAMIKNWNELTAQTVENF